MAAKIERYLQNDQQRIVARAWVPLQDVQHGVVEIRILQRALDQLRLDPAFGAGSARGAGAGSHIGRIRCGVRDRAGPAASASVDNNGNRYTSRWHDALSLRVANLTGPNGCAAPANKWLGLY